MAARIPIDVVYSHPGGRGWGPIELLAELAAQELGGRLIRYDASREYSKATVIRGLRPRFSGGKRKLLVIAPQPANLNAVLHTGPWLSRYERVSGWIIDSFWTDRIPRVTRGSYFDNIYVTDPDDVAPWQMAASGKVACLPWGTDALSASKEIRYKTLDLLRVGRQPAEWEDDYDSVTAAESVGLRYSGRPTFGKDDSESQRILNQSLASAKYVLAFSNRVNPTSYTHPSKEYITARWMDSLAHGAVVAGVAPESAAALELLWPGACLDLGTVERSQGLAVVAEAAKQWTPAVAEINRAEALIRLDWRHRLKVIANDMNLDAPALQASLSEVAAASSAQVRQG